MRPRATKQLAAAWTLGLLSALASLVVGGVGARALAQATPATSASKVEAEVGAFLEHYLEALESRDETIVRELFVDDGRLAWFTDGERSYASADEVLAGLRRFGDMRFETKLSDVRVLPFGPGRAIASSRFQTALNLPDGGHHAYGGVITWVLERSEPDADRGPWKVVGGHTSTPGGPPRDERGAKAGR